MLNFSKKLFGFAGAVTMFTGISYGQLNCTAGNGGNQAPLSSLIGASFIRAEGQTELVPTITIACSGAAAGQGPATLTVYLSPAVTVTSALIAGSSTNTEAVATAFAGAVAGGVSTSAVVSGSSITFSSIPVTAGTTSIQISNIRVNATAIPSAAGAAPTALTAQAFFSGTGVTPGPTNSATAAFVTNGLKPATFGSNVAATDGRIILANGTNNALASSNTGSFGVCGSINGSTGGSALPDFYVSIGENFQNAFKLNEASGIMPDAANSATRVKIVFSNIPAGLNIYMPLTLNNFTTVAGAVPQLVAVTSETGVKVLQTPVSSPTQLSTSGNFVQPIIPAAGATPANNYTAGGVFQVPVSNNTATAIYEVNVDNANVNDSFIAPVFLQTASNTVVSQSAAMTIQTSFAPVTAATAIPSFAVLSSSSPSLSVATFTQCTTTLLFPFVTNVAGFETGIAIDNTTKDPFGTKNQSGTCTLNFYGTGGSTVYTSGPAPNPNEGGTAPYLAGESYAFTLTSALQSASSTNPATFQGYMIAQCNYTLAHGFAYITYAFPGTSSSTMGYLALALSRGASNAPETAVP